MRCRGWMTDNIRHDGHSNGRNTSCIQAGNIERIAEQVKNTKSALVGHLASNRRTPASVNIIS
jgi:hypothetical protein